MPKPHVLVVDDRKNMLHLLDKVLRRDAIVHTASSGADAIVALESLSIAVVICDLRMPDMSGLDVLRASKRLRPSAQFVLITAYASVPTAIDALREGAYDYVTKPFEPEALRSIVLRALHGEPATTEDPHHGDAQEVPRLDAEREPEGDDGLSREAPGSSSLELVPGLGDMKWQEAIEFGRREVARQYLQAVIQRYNGRVAEAALHAGIERESFYRLLRKFNVLPDGTVGGSND
jgi:DNA-binding NtrC family response regulator